jgi:hypothetical protein
MLCSILHLGLASKFFMDCRNITQGNFPVRIEINGLVADSARIRWFFDTAAWLSSVSDCGYRSSNEFID